MTHAKAGLACAYFFTAGLIIGAWLPPFILRHMNW